MVLRHSLVSCLIMTVATCASINFSSTPGLMRYRERDDVTFTWILDRKPERFIEIAVWYNGGVIIKQIADGTISAVSKYKDRVSMMVTDKTIEMTLTNVNQDDVIYGVYKIIASVVIDGSLMALTDNSAELYLFGKPTKPVISGITDIKEGNDITLSCTASPTSVPTKYQLPLRYTWTRGDINLTQALPSRHTINGHQLVISYVMRIDRNHHYTCIAGEDGGLSSESEDVLLRVLYTPGEATADIIQIGPLIEGENANTAITCSVSDPGYPQAIFKWSKDNQDQSGGENGTISIRQGTATVSKHDGTWKCTPSNSVGVGPSAVISVIVNAKARLSPPLPSTLTAVADPQGSFSVTCGFISKPAAIISWTYNNGQLPTSVITQPMTTTASGKKSIVTQKLLWNPDSDASSRRSAGGQYLCKGSVDLGTGRIDTKQSQMILNVEYGPYEIEFNITDTITAVAGLDQITSACNADCKPSCSYQWKKSGGSVVIPGRILDLHPVQKVDHGSYVCEASNKHTAVGLSKQFTLIVNFAPEIISFVPSTSSDIIQNNTLNITCEVSSRPKSTITITNINISDILLSVWDTHKAVYTFDRVHVLDSGVYQCSATNGIKPMTDVTRQMTLDIKGEYELCETQRTEEGKALYTNVTISVCLIANPFTQINKDNWTFKPNKQQMVQNLPGDVSILVKDTSHLYKKYVKLRIDKISESHYGIYKLKIRNNYNMHEMEYTFILLPEAPPVSPHDIKITYITAISIYLEWMAGFDGGPDQTFWLYVFDRDTSDWFIISNITDTSADQGGLIEYKLTQEQGVVPDHKYNIHVGAINSISNVTGPSLLVHTKPLPTFKSSTPDITYKHNRAEITWSINNLDSVTNILIEVCVSDGSLCKPAINVTSPEIQPYVIPLPEGATDKYTFIFTFYDGADFVNRVETTEMVKAVPSVAVIVGSLLAVFVGVGVFVTVIILWRKGVIPKVTTHKHRTKQEGRETVSYETVGMPPMQQSEMSSVYQQLTDPTLTVYNKSDITLQSVIINGAFYDIWNGKLKSRDNVLLDVVIKSSKDSHVVYLQYLKEQAAAMCKLSSNDYTTACFGISRDNKYLLMENASLGSLQKYLREQSDNAYYNVANDQNLSKLMNFIHQIIKGVKSVFHLQPPALFYCLSASNVLITNQQQCKLTGFATSTAVTEREKWEEEHNQPRPVRWLSPEAVKVNHMRESDIWSLGVLLWEITSHGKLPLADKTDEEIKQLILSGHRLLKPLNCTDELYDILCSCWQYQPHSRPSVDDVESRVLDITQYEVV